MGPLSCGMWMLWTEAGGGGVCLAERLWNSPLQQTRAAGLRKRTPQASERQAYFAAPRFWSMYVFVNLIRAHRGAQPTGK